MSRLTTRIPRILLAALLSTGAVTFLGAPQASAAGHQVVMSGYAFVPRSLTITAGDTVTWVNQDQAPHDVKTTSGPASVHSPMLNKGGTWSYTFTTAGTYGYVCTVHPGMTAQLMVQAAATRKSTTAAPAHQHSNPSGPTQTADRRTPARGTASTHPHNTASAAPVPTPSSSAPSRAQSTAPALQTQVPAAADSAASARPLDPLLVLAGVVAGVAVLCLLLVGSRSAAASGAPPTADGEADRK
ncbi:plastocyanin/azurin family copper-binding protein [Streptomyces sp. NPDC013157]|uniref:cupredoxin domain-containing protein n=1 Tax=Streptomyces sp. NPDC013157 TaxID=3364861 RepID=UPI00367B7BCC